MEFSAEVKPGYLSIPVIGAAILSSARCLWFWCRNDVFLSTNRRQIAVERSCTVVCGLMKCLCLFTLWCCTGACGNLPALLCVAFASEHLVKVLAGSTGIHWDSAPILAVCPCNKGICSALLGCIRQTIASCSRRGSLPLTQHCWSQAWRSWFSPGSSVRERCECVGEVEPRATQMVKGVGQLYYE